MIETNLGWAKTGQQAGLPPTLFSADSFLNAAFKSLNVGYFVSTRNLIKF
jgi:hypothetical protein